MKFKLVLFISVFVFLSAIAYSQDHPPRDPNRKMPPPSEMAKKDLENLKTELTLTDDQIPFIEKVLIDSYTKMQALFQPGEQPDFSKMMKIMEDRDNDVISVLTDEQVTKYKEYREQQRSKFRQGNRD